VVVIQVSQNLWILDFNIHIYLSLLSYVFSESISVIG
jgi:hypothetical protein